MAEEQQKQLEAGEVRQQSKKSEECHGFQRNKRPFGRPDCTEFLSTAAMVGQPGMSMSLCKLLQRCLRSDFVNGFQPSDQSVRVAGPDRLPATGPARGIERHFVFFKAR
jgi:hypothetical protein